MSPCTCITPSIGAIGCKSIATMRGRSPSLVAEHIRNKESKKPSDTHNQITHKQRVAHILTWNQGTVLLVHTGSGSKPTSANSKWSNQTKKLWYGWATGHGHKEGYLAPASRSSTQINHTFHSYNKPQRKVFFISSLLFVHGPSRQSYYSNRVSISKQVVQASKVIPWKMSNSWSIWRSLKALRALHPSSLAFR